MKFTNAIVKRPCQNIIQGLSKLNSEKPNYVLTLEQHKKYCEALETCGVQVYVMEADEKYPDSTFVEDTAVLIKACAIITNPGAKSRNNEIDAMIPVVKKFYDKVEYIQNPGTVDGGDVMNVDDFYYIGLSDRTNRDGVRQFIEILKKYGMDGTTVEMCKMLHLKSGLAYLGNDNLVIAGEFLENPMFDKFNKIKVPEKESYSANCININGTVFFPEGYPEIRKIVESFGYKTLVLEMSELRKVDGGLSCLSLLFNKE